MKQGFFSNWRKANLRSFMDLRLVSGRASILEMLRSIDVPGPTFGPTALHRAARWIESV